MAGAFQGDLNETPDFCGDYPLGTLHRRSPSLSCHDDMYEREYGQVHYGIDCHTGKPGKDGNDERDGAANAAMSKGDMEGACGATCEPRKWVQQSPVLA